MSHGCIELFNRLIHVHNIAASPDITIGMHVESP